MQRVQKVSCPGPAPSKRAVVRSLPVQRFDCSQDQLGRNRTRHQREGAVSALSLILILGPEVSKKRHSVRLKLTPA